MKARWRAGCAALTLAATLALAQAPAPEVAPVALAELLAQLPRANAELAVMGHEVQAAREKLPQAVALMDPRFKLEWEDLTRMGEQAPTLLPGEVGATVYSLTQEIPWSGKRQLRRDAAEVEVAVAQARQQQTREALALRLKATYLQRLWLQGSRVLAQENLELMLRLERVLQARYATGLSAQQDITRLHVEHTAMRVELVELANQYRQNTARINQLLGRPLQSALGPALALEPPPAADQRSPEVLTQRLQTANAALQVEAQRVRAAQKARDLALQGRYPDFAVGVSATQRQREVREWSLMLEATLPLRDGVLRSMEREAEAMLAAAQARRDALEQELLMQLEERRLALDAAVETERLMQFSLMPQADLTWQAALAAYENGKGEFAMLLDAQRQIRSAALARLKAQIDAQQQWAEMESLTGAGS